MVLGVVVGTGVGAVVIILLLITSMTLPKASTSVV